MNTLKPDDCYAFKWVIANREKEVIATHVFNPHNIAPYPNITSKEEIYRTSEGLIHSVAQFSLNDSHVLTVLSGARSDWESLHSRILTRFGNKASFDKSNFICQIKDVQFKELEAFFDLIEDEPHLAHVDFETEIAFNEFKKPPLSARLKAINYDLSTLPPKFFDTVVTMEVMDDPVIAIIDEPISIKDLTLDGKVKGWYTYDRKTFEKLKKCPVSNQPLKKNPWPASNLKWELIKIVREAEAHFQDQKNYSKS